VFWASLIQGCSETLPALRALYGENFGVRGQRVPGGGVVNI
jgi:hypothetical protein